MQLIALLLFIVALLLLVGALVSAWRRRDISADKLFDVEHTLLRNRVANIGVSMVLLAPRSIEAITNLLNTLYPATELVVTIDSHRQDALLRRLIERYAMIGVEHRHLIGCNSHVTGLYRSRRRAFRQLVVIETEEAEMSFEVAVAAATYDHILRVPRGAVLEEHAVGRMVAELGSAESIATTGVVSLTGATLQLMPRTGDNNIGIRYVVRPLAWYDTRPAYALFVAIGITLGTAALALLTKEPLASAAAMSLCGVLLCAMCVAARMLSQKSLLRTFSAVVENFYEDLLVYMKKISYLYLRKL